MPDKAPIDAMPTKQFFVDMLIKDIPLERAVLDLVDNCIDGAKRLRDPEGRDFTGLWVKLVLDGTSFVIEDNCGGFDSATARDYAFRFGRPKEARATPYSIGQFGVGMKRALFKFGREFSITSKTANESWSMDVDVDIWEQNSNWTFDFTEIVPRKVDEASQGTTITVRRLRPEVAARFETQWFQNQLGELIRVHQRQFVAKGLEIRIGANPALTAVDLNIYSGTVNYDDRLSRAMLEDVRVVATQATTGSVLVVSVQVEGSPTYISHDEEGEETVVGVNSIQELRDRYGAGPVPAEAIDADLNGWATAKLVRRMLKLTIQDALAKRNSGRPANQQIDFEQFAAFEYADGAKMTTICGVFVDRGQRNMFSACGFNELSFFQSSDEATRLVVPILTQREMRMLEAKLPDGTSPGLGGNIVPPRDADAFASLYRYLPNFGALEG